MSKSFPISPLSLIQRHANGIRRVVSIVGQSAVASGEFATRCRKFQQQAAAQATSLPKVADAIWNTEGLSITFGKFGLPDQTLHDPNIPRESFGIVHVGFGIGTAEYARFDPARLREIVETKCVSDYRSFTYEGIGSALLLYEPGLFKWINRVLGVISKNPPSAPDKSGFFARFFEMFPPEAQREFAHGYGRLVGFSRMSIHRAIRDAAQLPKEQVAPYLQGLAVAFGMLNCQDMPLVLEHSSVVSPGAARASFQNGLIWVLAYCDWFAPGLLAAWLPQGSLEEKLVEKARAESSFNAKRGYPVAGRLEEPVRE